MQHWLFISSFAANIYKHPLLRERISGVMIYFTIEKEITTY
jgi:hypothetical protein